MRWFIFLVAGLMGCGSDEASSTPPPGASATQASIDDACATQCAAQKKCNSMVDELTCVNSCKNQLAALGTKLRSDFVAATANCTKTASCDQLKDCNETAKATISPSPAVQAFCDELVKKVTECKGTTDKSKCLNDIKVFADSAIEGGRACLTKSCQDYGACVTSALGLR